MHVSLAPVKPDVELRAAPDRPAASPWRHHRRLLEDKACRPLPLLGELPPRERWDPLASVLARFQLGEAGEGRVARQIDEVRMPGVDGDYRAALKLFVKEEGRHARILAMLVRRLGGELLHHQGSNDLFRRCRRLLGLRFKLAVLLVAEVVGGVLYETLEQAWGEAGGVPALREIAGDECHHLRFHSAFLAGQSRRWPRRLGLRASFWLVGLGAMAVVLAENARDLRRLSLSPLAVGARILQRMRQADVLAFAEGQAALQEVRS